MTKGQLKDGRNIFILRTEHLVTANHFTNALTAEFYGNNECFPSKLSKKEAVKILRRELFFHGIYGRYCDTDESVGDDHMEEFNSVYEAAFNWVKDNYPYLKGEQ